MGFNQAKPGFNQQIWLYNVDEIVTIWYVAVSENPWGIHQKFLQMFARFSEYEDQPWNLKSYHEVPRGTLFSCHDSAIPGSAERIGDVMEEAGKARPSIWSFQFHGLDPYWEYLRNLYGKYH